MEITEKLITIAKRCKAVLGDADIGSQEQAIVTLIIASEDSHWFAPTCGHIMCHNCGKDFPAKDMHYEEVSEGEFYIPLPYCEACYTLPDRALDCVDDTDTIHDFTASECTIIEIEDDEFLNLLNQMKEVGE